jgi:hypothetical protein
MTKNILLAATAASVMAFAGAASAHTITFRAAADASNAAHINVTDATGTGTTYPLAQEAKTPSNTNVFALADALSSGTLPSGNVLLTIELVGNAKFATAPTAASVLPDTSGGGCTTFTAAPSVAPTATTATFIISNSAPDCSSYWMDLDLQVLGAGNVSVKTTLVTDGAMTPIDGGSATKVVISRPDAFAWTVDATIGGTTLGDGADNDTVATLDASPAYTAFKVATGFHDGVSETATVATLGTAALVVDETAQYGLLRTNDVVVAHVLDFDAVVTGDFSVLDADFGGVSDTDNGSSASFDDIEGAMALAKAGLPGNLTADNLFVVSKASAGAIASSTYTISATYELNSTFYNQETVADRALETIERDGTNIVFPWMNSSTIQSASGTTNIIRLANVSGVATGAVFAQVLNATGSAPGYTALTAPKQIFSSIAARGEQLINTATLTTELGDFGRGDVQVSIEARPEQVTARRYATLANGSMTEFQSGTVAGDQAVGTGAGIVYVP